MNLKVNQIPILTTQHHLQIQMKVFIIKIVIKDYFQIDLIITLSYLNLIIHLILVKI